MPKVTEQHLEAKRREILHAAIACFARQGFHKTTMGDIAAEAGVSDGLAYRYFSSKDEIIQEAARLGSVATQPILSGEPESDDAGAMLELLYRSSFERFALPGREATLRLRFRAWAEALDDDAVRAEVVGRWKHHADVVERLLADGQEQGLIARDLDVHAIASVLLAVHDGLDVQWSLEKDLDVERCRDVVLALITGRFRAAGDSGESRMQPREVPPDDGP